MNAEGKTLYAIAIENHTTKFADVLYMHAKDRAECVNTLLTSKQLRKDTRVIGIAPVVGVWITETTDGKREEVRL
jgi:hypothetical protein